MARFSSLWQNKVISSVFFSGHERSVKVKKNILASLLLKGISIVINLLLVAITINYLTPVKYGIWITLTSVIMWLNFFDIGLGNGLRNKFTISKAEGKEELIRTYISTSYAITAITSLVLFVLFSIIHQFLDWGKIFNTSTDVQEIGMLVYIIFSSFCLQFIIRLINVIFTADQSPAMSSLINTTGSLLSLAIVYVLAKTTHGSLLYFGVSYSLVNLIVPLVASIWFFNGVYKKYSPSFRFIDFSKSKELLRSGGRIFITQIAALIIFTTDNIIITQVSGPEDVTPYNIAFKYFGIITMSFSILTAPLWSANTEAYVKDDFSWLKNTMKKMIKLWSIFAVLAVVMLLLSNYAYHLWVGDKVKVPFSLSVLMAIYVIMSSVVMIFANFLTGVNKIQLSLYHSIFFGLANIPLAIYFAKNLGLGSAGVLAATCCGVLVSILFQPIQCWKIINKTAKGIWNK